MKKLISLLLVLCMAFSLMAMSVSAEEEYPDVPANNQAANFQDDLQFVYESGIYDVEQDVDNYLTGDVTRGEYALYLARLLSNDAYKSIDLNGELQMTFTDLEDQPDEIKKAIEWCYQKDLVSGYTAESYKPNKAATREEICALLARAMMNGIMEAPTNVTPNITTLVDSDKISGYAVKYVEYCVQYGLIVGDNNGKFNPSEPMSTVHMAAVLNRYEHNKDMAQNTTKFVLSVETGEGNGYATIAVNDAYIMQITLSELELDPSHIELGAAMYNVGSLGVGETRKSHSVIVETDLTGSPALPNWMIETWGFEGANIDITINADGQQKVCTYTVSAERVEVTNGAYDLVITFVPMNVQHTREAWHLLVNDDHLTVTDDNAEDDSYIVIGYDSFLQMGDEILCFEDEYVGDLKLDNFNNLSALKQTIKDAVRVDDYYLEEGNPAISAVLTEGTELRVGQTSAVLTRNVTLKIEDVNAELVNGYLSQIRDAANETTMALAKTLIGMLDAAVGAVDDAENVGIIINVADAVDAE